MNSIFFRNNANTLNYEHDFNIDLGQFSCSDMLPDNRFMAFFEDLTSDFVLMQQQNTPSNQTTTSLNTDNSHRLNPFDNRVKVKHLVPDVDIIGFSASPAHTQSVRGLSIQAARFTLHHLTELEQSLNVLKQNTPNQTTKNTIGNLNTQVFVLRQTTKNIIKQLTNNPNAEHLNPSHTQSNKNFCQELKQTLTHAHESMKGLIKLSRLVNIANINRQLVIMQMVLHNIINTITEFKSFC